MCAEAHASPRAWTSADTLWRIRATKHPKSKHAGTSPHRRETLRIIKEACVSEAPPDKNNQDNLQVGRTTDASLGLRPPHSEEDAEKEGKREGA